MIIRNFFRWLTTLEMKIADGYLFQITLVFPEKNPAAIVIIVYKTYKVNLNHILIIITKTVFNDFLTTPRLTNACHNTYL